MTGLSPDGHRDVATTDSDGPFDRVIAEIEEFAEWARDWPGAEPGSDLDEDRAALGFSGSTDAMLCRYFFSATDHLWSVTALIEGDRRVPLFSPFTLLRSAHETISRILWLLAPDNRSERVRRLRLCALQERANFLKSVNDLAAHTTVEKPAWFDGDVRNTRRTIDEIHTLICSSGCARNANHLLAALNTATIVAEAHAFLDVHDKGVGTTAGGLGRALWRFQSGVAHGLLWTNDFTVTAVPDASHAERVELTGNPGLLAVDLKLQILYAKHAARLYQQRASAPE